MENVMAWKFFWMAIIIILAFIIFISLLVAEAAEKRGRSYFGWWFLSLIMSPLICMIFLVALGETEDKWRERIMEEEELRNRVKYRELN